MWRKAPVGREARRSRRDRGAMLLAVLFMMAIMILTAMAVAPAMIQQAKRDREEEMIHRGTEYARAVKKYYKKYGQYPANLEQLENTNNIRFLRKRFKDPLAKDGQWKLLRYGDIQSIVGGAGFGVPRVGGQGGLQTPGGLNAPSAGLGANTAPQGAQLSPLQQSPFLGGATQNGALQGGAQQLAAAQQASGLAAASAAAASGQSGFSPNTGSDQSGSGTGQTQGSTGNAPSGTGQSGSNNTIFGNTGVGGQTFGGGAIVGVASKDKEQTIRIFNKKKTYDEWIFIYSPMLDLQNTLLRGPYNGQTLNSGQFGTPAGQLNQANPGGLGQQPGSLGQQNPQSNQPNQPLTPGGQFPPDQNPPQ